MLMINGNTQSYTDHVMQKILPCMAKCYIAKTNPNFWQKLFRQNHEKKLERWLGLLLMAMRMDGRLHHGACETEVKETLYAVFIQYQDSNWPEAILHAHDLFSPAAERADALIVKCMFAN